jgi:hypothetical protein
MRSPRPVNVGVRRIAMRGRTRTLVVIGLPLTAAAVISFAAWLAWRPIVPVTVIVRNGTAKPIVAVRLEHERGVEVVENIAPTESKMIRFAAGGETSYTLRVRFLDGSEVSSNPQYAEAGYEFTETVSDSGIESDVRLPELY